MSRPLRVLITSGPTREPIDAVRFLSNASTGYMGTQLAQAAVDRGHRVTVISGPVSEPLPRRARVVRVERARQMQAALYRRARQADVVIMAAAVSDFQLRRPTRGKIRRAGTLRLHLTATPDLLAGLPRRAGQVVAGFALERGQAVVRAGEKLRKKRLDLMLAQEIGPRGSPFGRRAVRAWLLERGGVIPLGRCSKATVARRLLDKAETLWYGQHMLSPRRKRSYALVA